MSGRYKAGLTSFFYLSLLVGFVSLSGCQSSRVRYFDRVHHGMEKDQVIETAGSPHVTRRVKGRDSWTYIYRDAPGGTQTREVLFENGKVVYAGEKRQPKVTAEEQDRINEQAETEYQEQEQADTSERDAELGIARLKVPAKREERKAAKKPKLDRLDRAIRNDMYGTSDSIEIEKRKRAPVYEPIN